MALKLADIVVLLCERGSTMYGRECVTQFEHALQCAALAQENGATPTLVVASLLHDLGHLLVEHPDREIALDIDDVHQYIAIPFLRHMFPAAVVDPISLHVDAKRYLCFAEPSYWDTLSIESKCSLEKQGGAYLPAEAALFMAKPFAHDAIKLRRWDDLAKMPGKLTPPLARYIDLMAAVAKPSFAASGS
jgi:phosphonate degradation associated HDIG domain protein